MIEIKVDVGEVRKKLELLARQSADMRRLMKNIAEIMHDAVEENFRQEGRPKWKPLSSKTIKLRQKKGYWPGKILQMRGQLAVSINSKYTNNTAIVGTNLKYAAIHQFGGKAGRKNKVEIPARPFLKLTDKDLEDIKEKILEFYRVKTSR